MDCKHKFYFIVQSAYISWTILHLATRMIKIELGGFSPFDASRNPTSISQKWKRWLPGFQPYAYGKGLILMDIKDDNKIQRQALLQDSARQEVQDIIMQCSPNMGGAKRSRKSIKQVFHDLSECPL